MKIIFRFDFDLVLKRFEENYMVLNADKCHFMCRAMIRKIKLLSLIISSSIKARKRKSLGLLLTSS